MQDADGMFIFLFQKVSSFWQEKLRKLQIALLEFPEFSSELELELEVIHAGRG